jgi:MFS family permease
MTILATISDFRKKMLFVGLAAACFGIGLVLGPVLGGV